MVLFKSFRTIKITLIITKMVHGITILSFATLVLTSHFFEKGTEGSLRDAALFILQVSLYLEYLFAGLLLLLNIYRLIISLVNGSSVENKLSKMIFFKEEKMRKKRF